MSRILTLSVVAVFLAVATVPSAPAQTTDPHDPTANWIRLTVMNLPGPANLIPDQDPWVMVESSDMPCSTSTERVGAEVTFRTTCRAPPGDGCREMVQYVTTGVGVTDLRQGCTDIKFLWWNSVDFYQGCEKNGPGVERRCGIVFYPNSYKVDDYVCEVTTSPALQTVSTHCEYGEGLSPF